MLLGNLKEEELPLRIQEMQDAVPTAVVKGYPELRLSASVGGVYGVPSLGGVIRRVNQRM